MTGSRGPSHVSGRRATAYTRSTPAGSSAGASPRRARTSALSVATTTSSGQRRTRIGAPTTAITDRTGIRDPGPAPDPGQQQLPDPGGLGTGPRHRVGGDPGDDQPLAVEQDRAVPVVPGVDHADPRRADQDVVEIGRPALERDRVQHPPPG
ncbi:hypothetical protein AFB00_12490 [Pseudonocardia sp. HH130630-07]|nr:hypothetical protein AFB00_12490 [Pseudonocardia sp. HH130630-07]